MPYDPTAHQNAASIGYGLGALFSNIRQGRADRKEGYKVKQMLLDFIKSSPSFQQPPTVTEGVPGGTVKSYNPDVLTGYVNGVPQRGATITTQGTGAMTVPGDLTPEADILYKQVEAMRPRGSLLNPLMAQVTGKSEDIARAKAAAERPDYGFMNVPDVGVIRTERKTGEAQLMPGLGAPVKETPLPRHLVVGGAAYLLDAEGNIVDSDLTQPGIQPLVEGAKEDDSKIVTHWDDVAGIGRNKHGAIAVQYTPHPTKPEKILIGQPDGTYITVDKNALTVGQVVGQPRPAKPLDREVARGAAYRAIHTVASRYGVNFTPEQFKEAGAGDAFVDADNSLNILAAQQFVDKHWGGGWRGIGGRSEEAKAVIVKEIMDAYARDVGSTSALDALDKEFGGSLSGAE